MSFMLGRLLRSCAAPVQDKCWRWRLYMQDPGIEFARCYGNKKHTGEHHLVQRPGTDQHSFFHSSCTDLQCSRGGKATIPRCCNQRMCQEGRMDTGTKQKKAWHDRTHCSLWQRGVHPCNISQALLILNHMGLMEVPINEVALSGVVSACEKASAWLEAVALLQAARFMSVQHESVLWRRSRAPLLHMSLIHLPAFLPQASRPMSCLAS